VFLAMTLAGLTSCSITGPSARTRDELELARNRQRWASARITDYEFDFQRSCFCEPEATQPVHIVVRQNAIVSVVRTSDGQPANGTFTVWPRVDELFLDVQQRLEQHIDRLDVTYDATLGYPRSIVADLVLMAVDDEYALTAGNLRRLP
jgi:hypothetical protein